MKCPHCFGLGYVVTMRSPVFGQQIPPPPPCTACDGKVVLPDPKPAPFISRATAAPSVDGAKQKSRAACAVTLTITLR